MARYDMDRDGVASVRAAVAGDPVLLRESADAVALGSAIARSGTGSGQTGIGWAPTGLATELDRFGVVHALLLDAMADALAALCGGLDLAVRGDRATELASVSALGSLAGTLGHEAVAGAPP
jgi:hypothetical protein